MFKTSKLKFYNLALKLKVSAGMLELIIKSVGIELILEG